MLIIALTGGIGSGKTTVSNLFKSKNIPVIDTDIISRELVEPGKPAYTQIISTFGDIILTENKEINRPVLRKLVFSSEQQRLKLEKILHPLIWSEVRAQLSAKDAPYCIVVVPLLFENKDNVKEVAFDRIIAIDIEENLQIDRVSKRDNCDEATVKNIIESQVSRQVRLEAADDVITNTGDIESLQQKVDKLHQQYLNFSK